MRLNLWWSVTLVLTACQPERPPVTFSIATPRVIDVITRTQLDLSLSVGVAEERESDRLVEVTEQRARVARDDGGTQVTWLEHPRWAGTHVVLDEGDSTERARAARDVAASVAGPSPLQVALAASPVPFQTRVSALEAVVAEHVREAMGPTSVLKDATLRLEAATDAVAVFSVGLSVATRTNAVELDARLSGTLEVSRETALPLSFTLEGPVSVASRSERDDAPTVEGSGALVLQRRLVLHDEAPLVSRVER